MNDKGKHPTNAFDTTILWDSSIEKLEKNIKELIRLAQDKVGYSPVLINWIMSRINLLQSLPAWLQWGIKELLREILEQTRNLSVLTDLAALKAASSNSSKL